MFCNDVSMVKTSPPLALLRPTLLSFEYVVFEAFFIAGARAYQESCQCVGVLTQEDYLGHEIVCSMR
jgi:hypothetical protein